MANAVANVEKDDESKRFYANAFYDILKDFKFIPGGRILANAGGNCTNVSLVNCFLSPQPKYDMDSVEGIMEVLKNQVLTLKSEGGWGLNCSFIRPRGSYIEGIGARTPGAVKYLELFDKSSEIITEGPGDYYIESKEKTPKNEKKKIRKGAMMLCLSCWHPDIYEFITAKQKPFHLTKMNMSVNVTNAFMDILNRVNELVKNNASQEEIDAVDFWQLRFPDTAFENINPNGMEIWINGRKKVTPLKFIAQLGLRICGKL